MAWEFVRLASGRFSLENDELEADALPEILSEIENALGRQRVKYNSRFGLDIASSAGAFELLIDGERITLGWDNWSGAFIMAWDTGGDRIIENCIKTIFL